MKTTKIVIFCLFCVNNVFSQGIFDLFKIQNMFDDVANYSEKYVSPATDGAIYLSSTGWINSAKKKKLWDLNIGISGNYFVVPKKDRLFTIKDSDFKFFDIENVSETQVPTAFGNNNQVYLVGSLFGNEMRIKTPKGVNQDYIFYPHLNINLGLPYGFELVTRTSSVSSFGDGKYQIYGYGLKHNLSQYFSKLEAKKFYFSIMPLYSREEIKINYLELPSNLGELGLNRIGTKIDTYHLNFAFSKEYRNFEFLGIITANYSNFKYEIERVNKDDTTFLPFDNLANTYFDKLEKPKKNLIYECAINYHLKDFSIVSSFGFGKFMNFNTGLTYKVN